MSDISASKRMERLWASQTAQVSFAGDDPIETRPSFMGAVHDFLTENKAGIAVKRVFFAGMAALALSSAIAKPVSFDFPTQAQGVSINAVENLSNGSNHIDADRLFKDKQKFNDVFSALAQDFNLELLSGDVHDADSINNFADSLVDKGVKTGYDLANSLVSTENAGSPVTMQFFSGIDAKGVSHHVAAVAYDSNHNHLLSDIFAGFEKINFGQDVNDVVENATWIHESMHALIKGSEFSGLEAWKAALNGDFKPYDSWHNSVQSQISHPEIRGLVDKEISLLKSSPAVYDTGNFLTAIREVQKSERYENYQENMADGLMSTKFLQDGFSISKDVGDARLARSDVDAVHDTSPGQMAITKNLSTAMLAGKSSSELASITAKTVQGAMGFDTHDFQVSDNHENDELVRIVGGAGSRAPIQNKQTISHDETPLINSQRMSNGSPGNRGGAYADNLIQHNSFTVSSKVSQANEFVVQAVHKAPTVLFEKPSSKDLFNSFDSLQTKLADFQVTDIQFPSQQQRTYFGVVVASSDLHIGLHTGRGVLVICEKSALDKSAEVGDQLAIKFNNGVGLVEDQSRGQSVER